LQRIEALIGHFGEEFMCELRELKLNAIEQEIIRVPGGTPSSLHKRPKIATCDLVRRFIIARVRVACGLVRARACVLTWRVSVRTPVSMRLSLRTSIAGSRTRHG
jgi:hypothetical protein